MIAERAVKAEKFYLTLQISKLQKNLHMMGIFTDKEGEKIKEMYVLPR